MRKDSFGYRHNNHSVGLATIHLVWIPKRRKPVLRGDIKLRLATILESVASDKGWIIKAKEIAPDHVHLLVEYDEKTAISEVVKAFKGRSSRMLREEFPELTKLDIRTADKSARVAFPPRVETTGLPSSRLFSC